MRKYLYLTLILIAFSCNSLSGQSLSPMIWCFGDSAEISFAGGSPVSVPGCLINCGEGTAVACDRETGELLFYTDGVNIWNKNNVIMPGNTIPLGGNPSSTQSALIVPVPGQNKQCFLFALDDQAGYYADGDSGLSYSIIDMSLDNGLGDVLQQPRELLSPTTEKLTATPMQNGKGFWVIVHLWNSDAFYAYPVTKSGIGTPVISHQGAIHTGTPVDECNEAIGYATVSPDGKMLADAIFSPTDKVELFTFDNNSGSITGLIFSDSNYAWLGNGWGPYGVTFSPNNKVLYITYQRSILYQNYLMQYDLSLASGQDMVASRDTFNCTGLVIGASAIAPDGRIYIANAIPSGGKYLDRINNPNVFGTGCGYEQKAFTLSYGGMIFGLPNYMYVNTSITDSLSIITGNGCSDSCGAIIIAEPLSGYPPFSYQWSGSSQNDSVAANLCTGKYYVSITDQFGATVTDSAVINTPPGSKPDVSITVSGNLIQCSNISSVQWYSNNVAIPGADNPTFIAPAPGSYVASGKDNNECNFTDTVQIAGTNYFFPNAFTPNGDGIDDTYFPMLQSGAVLLLFKIFDRTGELIYAGINQGWDGKYKGVEQPPAVYVYYAEIQSSDLNNNGQIGTQKVKGSFVLLR